MRYLILILVVTMGALPVYGQSSNEERAARLDSTYVGRIVLKHEASLLNATEWPTDQELTTYLDSLKFAREYLLATRIVGGSTTKLDSILMVGVPPEVTVKALQEMTCAELYEHEKRLLAEHMEIDTHFSRVRWSRALDAYNEKCR